SASRSAATPARTSNRPPPSPWCRAAANFLNYRIGSEGSQNQLFNFCKTAIIRLHTTASFPTIRRQPHRGDNGPGGRVPAECGRGANYRGPGRARNFPNTIRCLFANLLRNGPHVLGNGWGFSILV